MIEDRRKGMADPKLIGQINTFPGKESEWVSWSFQFLTWVGSHYESGQQLGLGKEPRGCPS
eukprot:1282038-Heterocapsa_arctica.AAC.1